MKKTIVLGIMIMLSLTVVSASYDFNYTRPNIGDYSYSVFEVSKELGNNNPISTLLYALLGYGRFWENKAYECEAELLTKPVRRSSSHSNPAQTPTPTVTIPKLPEEYQFADVNNDGHLNAFDLAHFRRTEAAIKAREPEGDLNGDGFVNAFDLAEVRRGIQAIRDYAS